MTHELRGHPAYQKPSAEIEQRARKSQVRYDKYTDVQIWAVIVKLRALDSTAPIIPKDLKLPEWKLFSNPDPAKNSDNLRLRIGTPPTKYGAWIESVVLIERLREVQALAGSRGLNLRVKIPPRNSCLCGRAPASTPVVPVRRTEQVLCDLIRGVERRLTTTSF